MSTAQYLADREHNKRLRWLRTATNFQKWWGNLTHLYVEKPDVTPCPRCRRSDPIDPGEDYIVRWGVMRRRHPMFEPDQIREIVRAGLRAEAAMLAKFQGGNRG